MLASLALSAMMRCDVLATGRQGGGPAIESPALVLVAVAVAVGVPARASQAAPLNSLAWGRASERATGVAKVERRGNCEAGIWKGNWPSGMEVVRAQNGYRWSSSLDCQPASQPACLTSRRSSLSSGRPPLDPQARPSSALQAASRLGLLVSSANIVLQSRGVL